MFRRVLDAGDDEAAGRVGAEAGRDRAGVPGRVPFRQDAPADIVAERRGGDLEYGDVDLFGTQLRHDAGGVGVGGEHDPFRVDAAAGGGQMPCAVVAFELLDRAVGEDACARGDGGPAEAAHIGKGLDRSGAQIEQAGRIGGGAGFGTNFLGVQELDRRAAFRPLPRPFRDVGDTRGAGRTVDRAVFC